MSIDGHHLNGFDPLSEQFDDRTEDKDLFERATKRIVSNILKSYTSYFDLFSELLQNALDAIDGRHKAGDSSVGEIHIQIHIPNNIVTVIDNGIGMTDRELRYCFRPSVSFKNRREARGHKGVGATFLAYGFSRISVATKTKHGELAVSLSGGREWAEETGYTQPRPTFRAEKYNVPEIATAPSGTSVTVQIGTGNRPDLTWWNASSAAQWLEILKVKTPLGGVYLSGSTAPRIRVKVTVFDAASQKTDTETENAEYPYPHEIGGDILPKVKGVKDIAAHVLRSDGDHSRITSEFKNLSAMWDVWSENELLDDTHSFWSKAFDEADERLIRLHNISVYGCFLSSAKYWTQYQVEKLKIRRSPLLLKGGMQIASDYMVQGDLNVIPLTSTIGYQANTHVIIHLKDGNPDMGRKVFQPELKTLCEKISRQIVNIFKRYIYLMREDSGAPSVSASTALYNWQREQDEFEKNNPLNFVWNDNAISYSCMPRCEQDVIAIFHQLVGIGLIKGMSFLSTSQIHKYDSCFKTNYQNTKEFVFNAREVPLGVGSAHCLQHVSMPLVLEFKFDLDALISDIEKEEKFETEIHLVVCWQIGRGYEERYRISSMLVGDEGSTRQYYGSIHSLFLERQKRFEIIALSDLLEYIRQPEYIIALHQSHYRL